MRMNLTGAGVGQNKDNIRSGRWRRGAVNRSTGFSGLAVGKLKSASPPSPTADI